MCADYVCVDGDAAKKSPNTSMFPQPVAFPDSWVEIQTFDQVVLATSAL